MAQIKTERQYVVSLTKREFLVISKALRGTLKPEELEEARALQVALAVAKHEILKQELNESQKLMDNIEAETRGETA